MGALDGKVALITGAARAQGRSHAVRLAEEGADVIAFDLCAEATEVGYPPATKEDLDQTVAEVEATGRRIVARIGDVRDQTALDGAVADGVAELGRLDVVVANAGVSSWGRFWEMSEERWLSTIDINLTGVWRTLRAAAPVLIDQGEGGSIITICSVAGIKSLPGQAHYSAAKHGVVGLTRAFATDLAEHGIRVNCIHPAGVDTPMVNNPAMAELMANRDLTAWTNLLPVGRLDVSDVADALCWLVSDDARFVTGVSLPVDAGFTAK